jgi:hypothetical protein
MITKDTYIQLIVVEDDGKPANESTKIVALEFSGTVQVLWMEKEMRYSREP